MKRHLNSERGIMMPYCECPVELPGEGFRYLIISKLDCSIQPWSPLFVEQNLAMAHLNLTAAFNASDHVVAKGSRNFDIYQVDTSALRVAVKVPRPTSADAALRARRDQDFAEILLANQQSNFNTSFVCEMQIASVHRDTEVVTAGIMKWFNFGNLLEYLSDHRITSEDKLRLTKDIAHAVCHVHSKNRIVGNLHPRNIMITCSHSAILSDVGMANFTTIEQMETVPVPDLWWYRPPEEIQDAGVNHTIPGDVYSFATVSHTMYSPISQRDFVRVSQFGHQHLQQPTDMPNTLWELLKRCMRQNPEGRPDMTAVIETLKGV